MLIDVLWIDAIAVAFEIEDTTGNYSRIVRMLDLALEIDRVAGREFFRVAPDGCKEEVCAQFAGQHFSGLRAEPELSAVRRTAVSSGYDRSDNGMRAISYQ